MPPKQEKSPEGGKSWYAHFAEWASMVVGESWAFSASIAVIVIWLIAGVLVGFTEMWKEVMSLGIGIGSFLLLMLVQNTQNRGNDAIQIKLNELIRVIENADRTVMDIEELDEDEVQEFKKKYAQLAEEARQSDESQK